MNKKSIKILISIIILIAGLLISTNVNATDSPFEVFSDDIPGRIKEGRLGPHQIEGSSSIFYCAEGMSPYNATLSRARYSSWQENVDSYDDSMCHKTTKTDPYDGTALGDEYTTIKYEKQAWAIQDQALAFAIAEAERTGIDLFDMYMSRTIWGIQGINLGVMEEPNELATAAMHYRDYYNEIHKGDKTAISVNVTKAPFVKVAVDTTDDTYTVGSFTANISHNGGTSGGYIYVDNGNEGSEIDAALLEDLRKKELWPICKQVNDNIKDICNHIERHTTQSGNEITGFKKDEDGKTTIKYKTKTDDQKNAIKKLYNGYKTITTVNYNSSSAQMEEYIKQYKQLAKEVYNNIIKKNPNGEKLEKLKYIIDVSIKETTSKPAEVANINGTEDNNWNDFEFISAVEVYGFRGDDDTNPILIGGNYYNSETKGITIVDENGGEISNEIIINTDTEQTGNRNLPKKGQPFYVKFHLNNDAITKIGIKVYAKYLDNCEANAYYWYGYTKTYKWVNKIEAKSCCNWTHELKDAEGKVIRRWKTYAYYHHYELSWAVTDGVNGHGDKQTLIEIEELEEGSGVYGKKHWKEIDNGNNIPQTGTIITMDLEGYVKLDEYTGKGTSASNKIDDEDLCVENAEVWLYEYDNKIENAKAIRVTTTDSTGKYSFTGLNAQRKYYVQFVYDGMKFTNAEYDMSQIYNTSEWNAASKAKEDEGERTTFNKQFAEIGSYPANYQVTNMIFDKDVYIEVKGKYYNQTNLREDTTALFKQISTAIKNEYENNKSYDGTREAELDATSILKKACEKVAKANGGTPEVKRAIQYAVDCRINAYTAKDKVEIKYMDGNTTQTTKTYVYPVFDKFTITSTSQQKIAGETLNPIYNGQRNISLLLESRGTVNLALSKRVEQITVSINGGTTTYDDFVDRKKADVEIPSDYYENYIEYIRKDYSGTSTVSDKIMNSVTEVKKKSYATSQDITLLTRKEDIKNGINEDTKTNTKTNTVTANEYTLEDGVNYDAISLYEVPDDEKLDIEVIYRLRVTNYSPTIAAVTEVVDYYDSDYQLVGAYASLQDAQNKKNPITAKENSKYGDVTEYKDNGNYYGYKTIYIKPNEARIVDANGMDKFQDIYIVFKLYGDNTAAELLRDKGLLNGSTYESLNVAEINGYKTYTAANGTETPGLIDSNSNPGNYQINNQPNRNFKQITNDKVEDDTSNAETIVWSSDVEPRTISGIVFEDKANNDKEGTERKEYDFDDETIWTGASRVGNGMYDGEKTDRTIQGVIVELCEIKNNTTKVISRTKTDANGEYKFTGYIPGHYTIKYIYGRDNDTVLNTQASYNGQDYQSTTYIPKYDSRDTIVDGIIDYGMETDGNGNTIPRYWYTDSNNGEAARLSDAQDNQDRVNEVINYSKEKYGVDIVNHKAEVFNSYKQREDGTYNGNLLSELKEHTYRYAYSPVIYVEVEYATENITGNQVRESYNHNITNVDFGIVERPRSELVIDQDIARIKVTAADGVTILFDSNGKGTTSNLQWINEKKFTMYRGGTIDEYGKNELVNIIMDEELISGAKLEVTYRFTVTNNSEADNGSITRAKTIVNYVANNLEFDATDTRNTGWAVVENRDALQNVTESTYVASTVDLTTQAVILQTTTDDKTGLTKSLAPGESTSAELVLTKVLSAESTTDDLTYTNLTEIVEIDNTVGRYDHGATPGNQSLAQHPQEHDAAGASKYDNMSNYITPPDGVVIVTPPTGSQYIYYVIGITAAVILAAGIYLIKKFVIDKNK